MRAKMMSYESKLLGAEESGESVGKVHALVSVWDVVDWDGDRVIKGAFTDTLGKWRAKGDPIPWIHSHQWGDLGSYVGWVPPDEAEETDRGLEVTAYMDLDDRDSKKMYQMLKNRIITQFSFAYNVLEDEETSEKTDRGPLGKVLEIHKLELYECGPTLLGSNSETELLEVAARRFEKQITDAERSRLRRAVALIQGVIGGDGGDETEEDSKAGEAEAKGAIGIGSGPSSTSDDAWDAGAVRRNLSNDAGASVYRRVFAWVDPDGDPDTLSAYKFPHHFVSSSGSVGAASTRACSASVAALNGGRGGADIPSGDRRGVYNHVAGHLRAADMEPPELAAGEAEDTEASSEEKDGSAEVVQIQALAAGVVR